MSAPSRPLDGIRVVELAGVGPGPFAVMMLADLGAEVVRIERAGPGLFPSDARDLTLRGRRSIALDLKSADGRAIARDLVDRADVLVEGYRPGVAERLGLGPDDALTTNPRLVYCRMTGWGQDGPLASTAGHDITYLARTGALARFRRAGSVPLAPVNLLGDFGGGATFAVIGVLAALHERSASGRGQVVDAAIVDGVSVLDGFIGSLANQGVWGGPVGHNLLDTGAPFYDVYPCADGRFVAVGALEPQFYDVLLELSDIRSHVDDDAWELLRREHRSDTTTWEAARPHWAALWASRTRDEWAAVFAGSDACVEPVLEPSEVAADPHTIARGSRVAAFGTTVPAPAPRLSRTPAAVGSAPTPAGAATDDILRELGRTDAQIEALRSAGAIG